MKTLLTVLTGATLALGLQGDDAPSTPDVQARPFAAAVVRFEQNATDGDVEVVFEVRGGAAGLSWLTITGPGGRKDRRPDAPRLAHDAGGPRGPGGH